VSIWAMAFCSKSGGITIFVFINSVCLIPTTVVPEALAFNSNLNFLEIK
jgi:hypothetical protein